MTDTAPSRTGEPLPRGRCQTMLRAVFRAVFRGDLVSQRLQQVATELAADTVAVLLVDPSGQFVDTYAAVGAQPSMRERVRVRVGVGFAGTIAQTGRPVVIEELGPDDVVNHVLREHHLRSLIGVPLTSPSGALGVLYAGSPTALRFATDDVARLTGLAQLIALAIDAQLGAEERVATLALQRSLLPATPPTIAGLDIAARYLHAEGQLGVTGTTSSRCRAAGRAGHGRRGRPRFPGRRGDGPAAQRPAGLLAGVPLTRPRPCSTWTSRSSTSSRASSRPSFMRWPSTPTTSSGSARPGTRRHWWPAGGAGRGGAGRRPAARRPGRRPRRTTTIRVEEGEALVVFTDGLVERRPPSTYLAWPGATAVDDPARRRRPLLCGHHPDDVPDRPGAGRHGRPRRPPGRGRASG